MAMPSSAASACGRRTAEPRGHFVLSTAEDLLDLVFLKNRIIRQDLHSFRLGLLVDTGTSRATGTPRLVIVNSSPASTRRSNRDNCVFASVILTSLFMLLCLLSACSKSITDYPALPLRP